MITHDSPSIYQYMQDAVDAIPRSVHPTNKIAATLWVKNALGGDYSITCVNHWPSIIAERIGITPDIGSSSGTIHAETACILGSTAPTKGAALYITDPPCPNCMKNMAEAGIRALYIDHKGFDKDWAKRRGDSFDTMSMRIAERAGIDVYVLYRKEERFETISRHAMGYKPPVENPAVIAPADKADWEKLIADMNASYGDEPFAMGLGSDAQGAIISLVVDRHPTVGYTSDTVEDKMGKYSFIMQPLNRLLMIAASEGVVLMDDHIYSSRVPTSREFVNFVGAGFSALRIGRSELCRDDFGLSAMEMLKNAGILSIS